MGEYVRARYADEGVEVRTIGRAGSNPDAAWGDPDAIRATLEGARLLINLAGRSVNCRYTPKNRAIILNSRIDTTRALREAVAVASVPPPLWINSSTATIYRHAEDRPQTESAGELGEGFSVGIARAWEAEFFAGDLPDTRRVALRTAIVLGDGSVLTPLRRMARLGLGGAHHDGRWPASRARLAAGTYHRFRARGGRQRFSWVHLADVASAIGFVESHSELDGVINLSSPNPSDDRTVMRELRRAWRIPFGIPLFRWMLEVGSWAIRTETELLLKSRWVVPERLEAAGYRFAFPDLAEALQDIRNGRHR